MNNFMINKKKSLIVMYFDKGDEEVPHWREGPDEVGGIKGGNYRAQNCRCLGRVAENNVCTGEKSVRGGCVHAPQRIRCKARDVLVRVWIDRTHAHVV